LDAAETAVHLDRLIATGGSVGRALVHLGAGFPESCLEQVRDCRWALAGALEHSAEPQSHRVPQQRGEQPTVVPALARGVVAARVAALESPQKVAAQCLVSPQA
jgi:hypothetical protein